jgi:hypothetical protein
MPVDTFNILHFPCTYVTYIILHTNLLHGVFYLLIVAPTCFGPSSDHHQELVGISMCAPYVSSNLVEAVYILVQLKLKC